MFGRRKKPREDSAFNGNEYYLESLKELKERVRTTETEISKLYGDFRSLRGLVNRKLGRSSKRDDSNPVNELTEEEKQFIELLNPKDRTQVMESIKKLEDD